MSHTAQATLAVRFDTEKNKLLWNIPITQLTTGAASSRTTPKYDLVVHEVGAKEPEIPFYVDDAKVADISDDDSVSLVLRKGDRCQVFYLKNEGGDHFVGRTNPPLTCLLSPNSKSFASAVNSRLSRRDIGFSRQTWYSSNAMPPMEVRGNPKWIVSLKGNVVTIESNGTVPRPICSIPLDYLPQGYEWIEDDRKLRVFSRSGARYTDIEWDPPEAIEGLFWISPALLSVRGSTKTGRWFQSRIRSG